MPVRDDQPEMSPLQNWSWVLAEARAHVREPFRAPIIAVQAYEAWVIFMGKPREDA